MRVAIHQPHYMPWLGYLRKIKEADIFVYLDKVAYEKDGFQNRGRFLIDGREQWLTVPVMTKGKLGQSIKDVKIRESIQWVAKHHRTLLYNYRGIDENKKGILNEFFNFDSDRLIDWNIRSVDLLCDTLSIGTERVRESALNIKEPYPQSAKTKSDICTGRVVRICRELGADTYLSGVSRKDYIDEKLFTDIGIEFMSWIPQSRLSGLHFYLKDEAELSGDEMRIGSR